MKLSAPTTIVWWIALILGALGVILYAKLITIAALAPYAIWMIVAGWVLLLLATLLRRM